MYLLCISIVQMVKRVITMLKGLLIHGNFWVSTRHFHVSGVSKGVRVSEGVRVTG